MERRIAVTDIHGCFHSLKNLLEEKVELKKNDHLYLLGDYINKGPHSKQVLDYLLELQEKEYTLHLLRGNHEQELLNVLDGSTSYDTFISKGGETLLKSFELNHPSQVPSPYIEFTRSMGYFIELPDFYLVHAGFDFSKSNPFLDGEELVNIRDYQVDLEKTGGRKIIHGHSPTDLDQILQSLQQKENLHYSLDAGCAYRDNPKQAHLIALDLDSWKVFIQPNIDPSVNYD